MASTSSYHQRDAFAGIKPPNTRGEIEGTSKLYDVFINHRGPDVKQTLATQLYKSLEDLDIKTFLDSEEKELGASFPSIIEAAIRSASVHIAIFSPRYAESPWCLAELVLMLQSQSKIVPVFYEVKPSDLRYIESGAYADAFLQYQKKGRYLNKIEEWKKALQHVSYTAGHELKNSESLECTDVISTVEKEVQRAKPLHVAEHPVGLHKLVKDFERQCLDELVQDFERQCRFKKPAREKANIVGIFGMGGVGKTTLSLELFNKNKSKYTRASFLYDVREAYKRDNFPILQCQLLKDVFFDSIQNFSSDKVGTNHVRDSFRRSSSLSFLIVLDDVDHVEQLYALLPMSILNKHSNNNHLIIITTRDVGVLASAGIDIAYNLGGLDTKYGRELFCWNAFKRPQPDKGYEDLVEDFVNMCGSLPLSLIVLGRHVSRRSDMLYWQEELEKLRKALPGDVKKRLKISFDSLENEEKHIFVDIACFFVGKPITKAMSIWRVSGWTARHALETLKDKCLVEEFGVEDADWLDKSAFKMHDHLRDLGREMAEEMKQPSCRVWHPEHLKSLESKGFPNILEQTKGRCFHSIVDKSIGSKITYFLEGPDTPSLVWLQIEYPRYQPVYRKPDENSNIFSRIPLQSLQYLKISNVCFQKLWQSEVQAPPNLKELHITSCKNLTRLQATPDLCKLVQLKISECQQLEELRLAHMSCLKNISIENCDRLKSVSGISKLARLVELRISGCTMLEFESTCLSNMKHLERITFDVYVKMTYFELNGCVVLKTVDFDFRSVVNLSIRHCAKLEQLPDLSGPSCLERIIIDGCGNLKYLRLNRLENLKSV